MDASARLSEEQQSPIAAEAPQIFISYAREDVAFVERLALRLEDADRTRLWRADGESISVLRGHRASVTHAAFSPHGEYVVTSGGDGTVRVWEAETGDSVAVFRGHIRTVNRAVFSPSGKYIASAGVDRTARVFFCWLCRSIDQLVDLGERSLPRTTTASG